MTNYEHDESNAFRRFIEDELDLDGLPAPDAELSQGQESRRDYSLIPSEAQRAQLEQDIREIWDALQQEKPGKFYWRQHLSPLERDTREILQEIILATLRFVSLSTLVIGISEV